ncbi:MAG: glycosyltransferase family 2 protein [Eggerthellaceae bacterium]|nr:glycosyltransferase family 2 protein [Eggerthellaceae bacterium]
MPSVDGHPLTGAQRLDTSIVVPAYNVEGFLGEFFACVAAQSYRGFRIVFVDDCSTDGTRSVASRYGESLGGRFVLLDTGAHVGLSEARNRGIEWVEAHPTDYLSFLDADDLFDAEYMEDLHSRAVATKADLVVAGVVRTDGYSGHVYAVEMLHCPDEVFDRACECDELAFANPCSYAKLYRLSAVEGVRFRPILRSEDTCYLFEALARIRGVAFTNHAHYRYRTRDQSLTARMGQAQHLSMHEHFAQMLPLFEQEPHVQYRDQFETQVFIRSSIGGVIRRVRKGEARASALARKERDWLDAAMPRWRSNSFLTFGGRKSPSVKQFAVKACAALYKVGLFPLFVGAYAAFSRVFGREVRL